MYNKKVPLPAKVGFSNYGPDVITVEDFRFECEEHFTTDDGHGYPVLNGYYNDGIVITSDRLDRIPADATHILWYNR